MKNEQAFELKAEGLDSLSDNELIAEFLGIEMTVEKGTRYWHYIDRENKKMIYALKEQYLKFNTSWDWLMPVVEKIENLYYDVTITPTGLYIESTEHTEEDFCEQEVYYEQENETKIRVVYRGVIKFIKWYNPQRVGAFNSNASADTNQEK